MNIHLNYYRLFSPDQFVSLTVELLETVVRVVSQLLL